MDIREVVKACRAYVLDFDDTVAATFEVRADLLARALSDFGYPSTKAIVAEHWGRPFLNLVNTLAPGINADAFLGHYQKLMFNQPPRLTAGARRLLEQLEFMSIPRLIHSSSLTGLILQDLEVLGVAHLVNGVFGSDLTSHAKPDPRALDMAMKWLEERSYARSEIAYLGDSVSDLAVALGNQVHFVAVITGPTAADAFFKAGMDGPLVSSLDELADLIAEQVGGRMADEE